jgi:hypothetical protein
MERRTLVLVMMALGLAMDAAPAVAQDTTRLFATGNSQTTACLGWLEPLAGFYQAAGLPFSYVHQGGAARISDHVRKLNDLRTGQSHVVLMTQTGDWLLGDPEQIYKDGEALQDVIVGAGAQAVIHTSHAINPMQEAVVDQLDTHYRTLKARMEARVVGGKTREVLLIPTLRLWLEGDAAYPRAPRPAGEDCTTGFLADPLHNGYLGQFTNAALMFAYFTCTDPRTIAFNGRVEAARAAWAKGKAWQYFDRARPRACGASQAGTDAGVGPTDGGARGDGATSLPDLGTRDGGNALPGQRSDAAPSPPPLGARDSGLAAADASAPLPPAPPVPPAPARTDAAILSLPPPGTVSPPGPQDAASPPPPAAPATKGRSGGCSTMGDSGSRSSLLVIAVTLATAFARRRRARSAHEATRTGGPRSAGAT